MTAGIYNITIEQGTTYSKDFYYQNDDGTPINLTGYAASLQIRRAFSDTVPIFTASSAGYSGYSGTNLIIITGTTGKISLTIPASTSTAFDFDSALYDLEISISGTVTRILQGTVTLNREVTKI